MSDINQAKEAVRNRVWRLLEREGAVPEGSYGKIPGFYGNEATAECLAELEVWRNAGTIKANPDWAQLPTRIRALQDDKLLYMAVPRMASLKPFYLLDPDSLSLSPEEAAEKKGAEQIARRVGVDGMRPIDVVICGSVAVNRSGARIGSGPATPTWKSRCSSRLGSSQRRQPSWRPCTRFRSSTRRSPRPRMTSVSTSSSRRRRSSRARNAVG